MVLCADRCVVVLCCVTEETAVCRPVCCGVVLLKEMAECLTVCCGVVLCYWGDGRVPDDVLWCCVTVETAECLTVCCGVVLCY